MLTMTAATYIINHSIITNMKAEALKMAELYENNIKIEININKENGLAKINIVEYNV